MPRFGSASLEFTVLHIIPQRLGHGGSRLRKTIFGSQLGQHHGEVLGHVDHSRGNRWADVVEKADITGRTRPRLAGRVHVQVMALVHLIEHLLSDLQVFWLEAAWLTSDTSPDLLAQLVQLPLHLVAIADLGYVAGIVVDAVEVGSVCISAGPLHPTAVNGMLGVGGIRHHAQHRLPYLVFQGALTDPIGAIEEAQHLHAELVRVGAIATALLFDRHHRVVTVTLVLLNRLFGVGSSLKVLADVLVPLASLNHVVAVAGQREVRAMLQGVLHLLAHLGSHGTPLVYT